MPDEARHVVAQWFCQQAVSCAELGSPLYAAMLPHIAADVVAGKYDEVLAPLEQWRFGDALPLRLLGAAHALALGGKAPLLAEAYPSCGQTSARAPEPRALADALADAVTRHPQLASDYLSRAVQTNETGRAAALVLGLSALAEQSGGSRSEIALVEIGCSAGLNLRLDHFGYADGAELVGGDPDSPVRLSPDWVERPPRLHEWNVTGRWGLDPHPMDPGEEATALRLRSYLWPDQTERRARLDAAIEMARDIPATVAQTDDTAADLRDLLGTLAGRAPVLVYHSIVWQYIPVAARTDITQTIEDAGGQATSAAPLMRLSFEPDGMRRDRASVELRTWPGGSGRLLAHADFHGRWVHCLPR